MEAFRIQILLSLQPNAILFKSNGHSSIDEIREDVVCKFANMSPFKLKQTNCRFIDVVQKILFLLFKFELQSPTTAFGGYSIVEGDEVTLKFILIVKIMFVD